MKGKWVLPTVLALVCGLLVLLISVVGAGGSGSLTRVTTASGPYRMSLNPSLNADGTIVGFDSGSDLLGQGIPSMIQEVWLYDTETMTYTRVTSASGSYRSSGYASLSAEGTVVAFHSESDLLGQGILDEQWEVWLYNTAAMTFTRVTTASEAGRGSNYPSLSDDGTAVAFESDSDLLDQGIQDDQWEVWLYDTAALTYTRVTTASDEGRESLYASLGADGTIVAFMSDSDLIEEGIPDDQFEIWLFDAGSGSLMRVTTASDDNRSSGAPSLSADGTIVAFESDSDFLGQGILDNQWEVWMYDTAAMTYTRVTTASDHNRDSGWPRLSADGTVVAFSSDSDLMGEGILDNQREVWLYNTVTMTYTRVTRASDGNRSSRYPDLSVDGTVVAFSSDSDFLGQGILDDQLEVWLYRPVQQLYLPLVLR